MAAIDSDNGRDVNQLLHPMIHYAHCVNCCRRGDMALHFNESFGESSCNNGCDVCNKKICYETIDVTQYCIILLRIIQENSRSKNAALSMPQFSNF